MADLDKFLSHVRTTGLASGTHYEVYFNWTGGEDLDTLSLLVDSCNMPGNNIMTQEMRTFGEITEMPYGVTYPPVTFNVLIDNTGSVKKHFEAWMNAVYDPTTKQIGYYADYVADVVINFQDKNGGIIRSVTLVEAYPKTVNDVSLGNDVHGVIRLDITMTYRYWYATDGEGISIEDVQKGEEQTANRAANTGVFFEHSNEESKRFKDALRDWGLANQIPGQLDQFGSDMSSSISRSLGSATRALSDKNGFHIPINAPNGNDLANDLKSGLNNLTSNFVKFGSGLSDLGKTLNNITAPVSAIAGAVGSMSGTLGAIDSTLGALGLGNPFAKVRQNLNKTAGDLGQVASLKRLPSHLGTIGANIGAMGSTFQQVSKSMDQVTSAPANFKSALNKLGFNMSRQGSNLSNGASNLDSYADINGFI